jgi:hypothetical protein
LPPARSGDSDIACCDLHVSPDTSVRRRGLGEHHPHGIQPDEGGRRRAGCWTNSASVPWFSTDEQLPGPGRTCGAQGPNCNASWITNPTTGCRWFRAVTRSLTRPWTARSQVRVTVVPVCESHVMTGTVTCRADADRVAEVIVAPRSHRSAPVVGLVPGSGQHPDRRQPAVSYPCARVVS